MLEGDSFLSDEQVARAHAALDTHLWSGDEWDLVGLEVKDLELPDSMRHYDVDAWAYAGELEEASRKGLTTAEPIVEFTFSVDLHVRADIAAEDVEPEWTVLDATETRALVGMILQMEGRVGLTFEDSEDLGHIDYIGVARAKGQQSRPMAITPEGSPSPAERPQEGQVLPFRRPPA